MTIHPTDRSPASQMSPARIVLTRQKQNRRARVPDPGGPPGTNFMSSLECQSTSDFSLPAAPLFRSVMFQVLPLLDDLKLLKK